MSKTKTIAINPVTGKVGCVLLQAALKCDVWNRLNSLFPVALWTTDPDGLVVLSYDSNEQLAELRRRLERMVEVPRG